MNARFLSSMLLSVAIAALAMSSAGACGGDEEVRQTETWGRTSGTGQNAVQGERTGVGGITEMTSSEALEAGMTLCEDGREEIRIGSFEHPGDVPPYETLEEEPADRGCVEAVRLLVDTQVDDEAEYALIARDLKARYAKLDAITVEFTDTSDTFAYDGGALIFNTPSGAYFMGYAYGPPNNDGYYVALSE
jgi:hypothetical protein